MTPPSPWKLKQLETQPNGAARCLAIKILPPLLQAPGAHHACCWSKGMFLKAEPRSLFQSPGPTPLLVNPNPIGARNANPCSFVLCSEEVACVLQSPIDSFHSLAGIFLQMRSSFPCSSVGSVRFVMMQFFTSSNARVVRSRGELPSPWSCQSLCH